MRTPFKLTLLAATLAAGCATVSPEAHRQLEEARSSYRVAADDPLVKQYSQPELSAAGRALQEAERMANAGADSTLVEHNAYLAERRARIALRTAQTRQAEADVIAAREERASQRRAQA
jgi:hypothetical protein